MKQKIFVIVGPTASGKSDLAVKLAQQFNGEVISADSRQVYRGLDLGTGKITTEEMQGITHYLLDVADPQDQFTVVEWKNLAAKAIEDIIGRGKLPIICGGTGFYISTLVDNLTLPDVTANPALREELSKKTTEELQKILTEIDPETAKSLNHSDKNNPRRLIRKIEIAKGAKSTILQRESSYESLWIGLDIPIDELREKIKIRLEKRLEKGMIAEVENLHKNGLSWNRMEELGLEYRFLARHLEGKFTLEQTKENLATEIGQYAKRQMTWFHKNKNINWFSPKDQEKISQLTQNFLKNNP